MYKKKESADKIYKKKKSFKIPHTNIPEFISYREHKHEIIMQTALKI